MVRKLSLYIAVIIGKTTTFLSRLLNLGGGTTITGKIALMICPSIIYELSRQSSRGNVIVTGTNGKTTTTKMIAQIFNEEGLSFINNVSGANLVGGVATVFIQAASLLGKIHTEIGLLEVDEANIPIVTGQVKPKAIVVTNLFRDQLDRYGELDYTAKLINKGLKELGSDSFAVLNADDPGVAALGVNLRSAVIYYGINKNVNWESEESKVSDTSRCPICGDALEYTKYFYSHLGHYACLQCGFKRPDAQVVLSELELMGVNGSNLLITADEVVRITLNIPGFYNIYNALAAVAYASNAGMNLQSIKSGLESFKNAFGRMEKVEIDGRKIILTLVKNPVAFNEVLRTITEDGTNINLLIIINDNYADGRDISWLWDTDFEILAGDGLEILKIIVSGLRADEMLLRLKYAGVDLGVTEVERNIHRALNRIICETPSGETIYIVPTYTAMLELRKIMERKGYLARYWEGEKNAT